MSTGHQLFVTYIHTYYMPVAETVERYEWQIQNATGDVVQRRFLTLKALALRTSVTSTTGNLFSQFLPQDSRRSHSVTSVKLYLLKQFLVKALARLISCWSHQFLQRFHIDCLGQYQTPAVMTSAQNQNAPAPGKEMLWGGRFTGILLQA